VRLLGAAGIVWCVSLASAHSPIIFMAGVLIVLVEVLVQELMARLQRAIASRFVLEMDGVESAR
jgi:hypothetical protein